MAETDTAVLEPVAETETLTEQEPLIEETVAQDGTDTDAGDSPETESFTKEQVEQQRKEAVELALAEAEAKRNDEVARARIAESEQWVRTAAYEHGETFFRRMAAQGAKWAEEGKTPDEAARLVQRVHIKQFLDEFSANVAPALTYETHQSHLTEMNRLVKDWFPGVKVAESAEAKFKESQNSGRGDAAIRGMLEYLLAVKETADSKNRETAQQQTAKKAGEVAKLQKGSATTGPAKVAGMSGGSGAAQLDAILNDLSKPAAERRQAFEKKYGFKPNF